MTNEGSEFYIGFMENHAGFGVDLPNDNHILLVTNEPETVTVNITLGSDFNEPNTLSHLITNRRSFLSEDAQVTGPADRNKGIQINTSANKSIAVYGINSEVDSLDGFLALPCVDIPLVSQYDYYAVSVPPQALQGLGDSAFLAVACQDETEISFVSTGPVPDPDNPSAMITEKTITINRGQTLYLESHDGDLTGSRVSSDKPISFYSGHECGGLRTGGSDECDHLVEQLPPTASWGTNFLTAPIAGRTTGDLIKLVTSQIGTTINITCVTTGITTLNIINLLVSGAYNFTVASDQYCSIESNNPILVVQIPSSSGVDDSFMTIVPAVSQYRNNLTVVPNTVGFVLARWINIFVPSIYYQPENITVGDDRLPSEGWVAIRCSNGGTCGYALQMSLSTSAARLVSHSNPEASLGVIVYGLGFSEAYGYPAGLALDREGELIAY